MDVIFAKAVPSPKHHYSRLLHKAPADDFFEAKQAASPRLYTARGVTKSHRRTSSEVPPEPPTSPPVHSQGEPSDFDDTLSRRTVEILSQKREVHDEVMLLIKRLKRQGQEACSEADRLRKELEDLKLIADEAVLKKREAEEECQRLREQLTPASPKATSKVRPNSRSAERQGARDAKGESKPTKECVGKGKPRVPGFVLK